MARRYRPRQFADLLGQESIAQTLINALKTGTVAHAYLFTGARGVGKTSCARILAKALNCQKGPTPTPCDQCSSCEAIGEGEDIDVREIDGASNRGIDDVRAIRQEVATRPTRSRYKIYIIDEVHMLTKESFNALLKTLEEPPDHVKFIFATTEIQKVPVTIVSRCQRFDFAQLSAERIMAHLRRIVETEGHVAEDEALELLARRAGGSMRDAQSLLDQALAFSDGTMTATAVRQLFGLPRGEVVSQIGAALVHRDTAAALRLLQESCRAGSAPVDLLDQLIDYWRDLLMLACLGKDARTLNFGGSLRETMAAQATSIDVDLLLAGLDVLTAARQRLRGTAHVSTILETAIVRLSRLDQLLPIGQLLERADPSRTSSTAGVESSQTSASSTKEPASGKKKSPEPPTSPSIQGPPNLDDVWPKLLDRLGFVLKTRLQTGSRPAILGPNTLVITFPSEYNAAYEYCAQPVSRQQIEEALRASAGPSWSVRLEREGSPHESPQPAVTTPASPRIRWEQTMKKHPLLTHAREVLDAIPTNIDPDFGQPSAQPMRDETNPTEEP